MNYQPVDDDKTGVCLEEKNAWLVMHDSMSTILFKKHSAIVMKFPKSYVVA